MAAVEPAELAATLERGGPAPEGAGDRFTGIAVLGVAFASGDVLALRRFPISSTGTAYTSVWHCTASGSWTLYTDVPGSGCGKHFGPAADHLVLAPIRVEWTGPRSVLIAVDGGRRVTWTLQMRSTVATRAFNLCAARLWRASLERPAMLNVIALLARGALNTGPVRLVGHAPSGARFLGYPSRLWIVRSSRACIDGHDTGPSRRLRRSLALGDFLIPRRGLVATVHAVITPIA